MPQDIALGARRNDLLDAVRAARSAIDAAPQPIAGAGEPQDTAAAFQVFSTLLAKESLRAALYSLVERTDYRYIAIFRLQGGRAAPIAYVDRDDPNVTQLAEVDDSATYCVYVRDRNGAFATADSLLDARTVDHPARHDIRSYCGIPILDPEGVDLGTLCHFDRVSRDPERLDLELLLQAASALAQPGRLPL